MIPVSFNPKYGEGSVTFSIAQKDKRCFPRSSNYGYSFCRLILVDEEGNYVSGTSGKPNRDLHLEVDNLQPGNYKLFAEVDWEQYEHQDFVLTAYGDSC